MKASPLADAKRRIRIHDLWRLCGLPGEPRKSCPSPFRPDHSPSFSVSADGLTWHDFGTGEGGSAVDFLQRARGLTQTDACRELVRLAGGGFAPSPLPRPSLPVPLASSCKIDLGHTSSGSHADWRTLANLRHLSPEAVSLAVRRGLLRFGRHAWHRAWFVTDATGHNAQARRLDGLLWSEIGGKKAWTICAPGNASWPVGAKEAAAFSSIAFCEGGPDMLAALHFILAEGRESDCAAVAMLGAGLAIHREALALFAGKRIRIFGHSDASGTGEKAVARWAEQLTRACAEVDAFRFAGLLKADGSPIKDLNDCTSVCADDFEANRDLWTLMP